jgi:hypothetical protein
MRRLNFDLQYPLFRTEHPGIEGKRRADGLSPAASGARFRETRSIPGRAGLGGTRAVSFAYFS